MKCDRVVLDLGVETEMRELNLGGMQEFAVRVTSPDEGVVGLDNELNV